jgi:hypothetical protein
MRHARTPFPQLTDYQLIKKQTIFAEPATHEKPGDFDRNPDTRQPFNTERNPQGVHL